MNPALENLMTRRSIRSYTAQAIPRGDLETIVDAARYAPSARNSQLWQFTVLRNKALLARLAGVIGDALCREGYDFYNADTLILVSCPRDYSFGPEDSACALDNIFLAAHALGIGSVWINQLRGICDRPAVREVLDALGVPAGHVVFGMAALGYAAAAPAVPDKKTDVVRWVE
jgi:nitroreductase